MRERWRPEDYEELTEKDKMESKCPSWRGMARGVIP